MKSSLLVKTIRRNWFSSAGKDTQKEKPFRSESKRP